MTVYIAAAESHADISLLKLIAWEVNVEWPDFVVYPCRHRSLEVTGEVVDVKGEVEALATDIKRDPSC